MHTEINAQCAYCRYSIILVYYTEHRHGDVNIPKVLYHSTTVKNVSFFFFSELRDKIQDWDRSCVLV